MANHTPGPWYKVSKFDDELCDNRWHISQSPEGGPYWIAELFGQLPKGQEEANANLIEAAPDLLEACKELADFAPSDGHRCLYCDARVYAVDSTDEHSPDCELIKAQTAIAKAEGKEAQDG